MRRKLILGIVLALCAIMATAVAPSSALAKKTGAAKNAGKSIIEDLRAAHKLLSEADHDYDGHRHLAAEAVHRAIEELEGEHHKKHAVAKSSAASEEPEKAAAPVQAAGGKESKESQEKSDAQLRQAKELIAGVQEKLTKKHAKAGGHAATALSEIDTALKTK